MGMGARSSMPIPGFAKESLMFYENIMFALPIAGWYLRSVSADRGRYSVACCDLTRTVLQGSFVYRVHAEVRLDSSGLPVVYAAWYETLSLPFSPGAPLPLQGEWNYGGLLPIQYVHLLAHA